MHLLFLLKMSFVCDVQFLVLQLWRWINMDNACYGSTLHVAYLSCRCILRINAYLKYLTIALSIRENSSYTLQKSPSGNKIIHTLWILKTCSRLNFNETNIFIAMLQCSYWSKGNAQMLLRGEFKEKCRKSLIIMSVSQMAFNEYSIICIRIV